MFNINNTQLTKVSVHHVGNKNNGEDLEISKTILDVNEEGLNERLKHFFLKSFDAVELYHFTSSNQDFILNPLFQFARDVFSLQADFHFSSINFAKHLYENSNHPNIKSGDLFVAFFHDMEIGHKIVDAIGIFKSENKQSFFKLEKNGQQFNLHSEIGINPDKLDKGCLIFDLDEDQGYQICITDKANKAGEAQFWKDQFLNLRPCKDEFHQTKNFLSIAKNYLTTAIIQDFELEKTDQIDLLNRSVDYFKNRDHFEKDEFEQEVFQDPKVIDSFRRFETQYKQEHQIEQEDSFDISLAAVKKQTKIFKSILKLDKNFHIYIHGNKEMIEKGTEKDGRKYYKIYYQNED
ncbi:MAG: nucleoid-associated protein [Bacteroidota bacterium]|nr:nucleoid-associated protein [Bacteroidota bacterium]